MWPVLRDDGSSLDYLNVTYSCSTMIKSGEAAVKQEISGSAELVELILDGAAKWALEIRCPKTLFARTWLDDDHVGTVVAQWDPSIVDGIVYAIPGLVAVERIGLSRSGLNPTWAKANLEVPKGWWLARGRPQAADLNHQLITFKADPAAAVGSMRIACSSDVPRFIVYLHPLEYSRARTDRDLQVAGLIAALAMLQDSPFFGYDGEGDSEHVVARELRARLEAADVSAWDEDGWDPARAATAIEPFYSPVVDESEEIVS